MSWETPLAYQVTIFGLILAIILAKYMHDYGDDRPYRAIPVVGTQEHDTGTWVAKKRYFNQAKTIINAGLKQHSGPFQIFANTGPKIIVPPTMIEEIALDPRLTFRGFVERDLFSDYRGFEAFHAIIQDGILLDTVRKKISNSLVAVTSIISDETKAALPELFPHGKEWRSVSFYPCAQILSARLSSRVFVGKELCRNQDWLQVSVAHAGGVFRAARALRIWPTFLQPIAHWFLPETSQLRRIQRRAMKIMNNHLNMNGGLLSQTDAWSWLQREAGERPYDFVNGQLGLSIAAINTTAGFLTNALYDLCAYPEYIDCLREEIEHVLGDDPIDRPKLLKLRLMDSFLKESQRLNPMALITMNRRAEEDVVLSDGTTIPKGALVAAPTTFMQSEEAYEEAHAFKGDRFLRLREVTGDEHKYVLPTTSTHHFGFGHGIHACPGRFFVATEIKVLLVHLLRDYDWHFATPHDSRPANICLGAENSPDPSIQIEFRVRRQIAS